MHITNLKQSISSDMPPNVCIHQFNFILSLDVTPVLHTVDLYTLIIYTVYTYINTSLPKHYTQGWPSISMQSTRVCVMQIFVISWCAPRLIFCTRGDIENKTIWNLKIITLITLTTDWLDSKTRSSLCPAWNITCVLVLYWSLLPTHVQSADKVQLVAHPPMRNKFQDKTKFTYLVLSVWYQFCLTLATFFSAERVTFLQSVRVCFINQDNNCKNKTLIVNWWNTVLVSISKLKA